MVYIYSPIEIKKETDANPFLLPLWYIASMRYMISYLCLYRQYLIHYLALSETYFPIILIPLQKSVIFPLLHLLLYMESIIHICFSNMLEKQEKAGVCMLHQLFLHFQLFHSNLHFIKMVCRICLYRVYSNMGK